MGKINPTFSKELKKYGAKEINACYNCGNCTAICSLSTKENSFPREMLRCSILGLENDIKSSLKPWLCYYCGECSSSCPREANPGELMMALRRWLSSKYDWTGLAGLLYKSTLMSLIAFILVAAGVIAFSASQDFNITRLLHKGHQFEQWAIALVFSIILLPNIFRMWLYVIIKPQIKVSLKSYINGLTELIVHMFTQKRSLGCDDSKFRWLEHLILVLGYLSLLFTTVVLDWFGTSSFFIIALGYVESILIFMITVHFIFGRAKKTNEVNKHSKPSDWLFIIWLSLMGLTAVIVRVSIDTNILEHHSWIYIAHLIILVQWALIIVPFGKWTHFLYRSFAMYFEKLIQLSK